MDFIQHFIDDDDDDDMDGGNNAEIAAPRAYNKLNNLRGSDRYKRHMETIQTALARDSSNDGVNGSAAAPGESNEDYRTIMATNKLMVDIADEALSIHKFLIDLYKKKFPELDALLPSPLDYARVVARLGNEMDMTAVDLEDLLPPTTVMAVTVTGSATSGVPLTDDELRKVLDGCQEILGLEEDRNSMINFVSSRMHILAPNITAIVGPGIAALLVGVAGGLNELAAMPACNIEVLGGKQKKNLGGFGRASGLIHAGNIYNCEIVQEGTCLLHLTLLQSSIFRPLLLPA